MRTSLERDLAFGAGIGWLGGQWLAAQPAIPVPNDGTAVVTGWRWHTPDSADLISDSEARSFVPNEVARLDDSAVQPVHSMEWLEQQGYVLVAVGVSDQAAFGWAPYYSLLFGTTGGLAFLASAVVIDRRRPI